MPRRLARVHGKLEDLLTDPSYEAYQDRWLHVTLTDERRPAGAMERLRGRFPHTLVLAFEPDGRAAERQTWSERVRQRSELDLARDFVVELTGAPPADAELALLCEAFESCRRAEAAR